MQPTFSDLRSSKPGVEIDLLTIINAADYCIGPLEDAEGQIACVANPIRDQEFRTVSCCFL